MPASVPIAASDISRVEHIKNDFPPGFTVTTRPAKPVGPDDVKSFKVNDLAEARILPPQCRAVVLPPYADPTAGTEAAQVTADGAAGRIEVFALRLAQPVPVEQTPQGCGLEILVSGSPDVAGPADHIDPPTIPGATTTGRKLNPEQKHPVYLFTAALDRQTSVVVMGSAAADLHPEHLMADLLTKAAAAVRGG